MDVLHANTMRFYLKLNEWRAVERHTDVMIVVGDQSFRCHRVVLAAASGYFDTVFSNQKDASSETIVLSGITHASTFESILKFVYSGNLIITQENVYDLLRATEFLKLDVGGIEDLFARFIKENLPVPNMHSIFAFARSSNKHNSLIQTMMSYFSEQFEQFATTKEFLHLPFDVLVKIISQCPASNECMYLNAIIRWVKYFCKERIQYFDKLTKSIEFEKISPNDLKHIFKKYVTETHLPESTDPANSQYFYNTVSNDEESLHVYMKCYPNMMMRASIDSSHKCTITLCEPFSFTGSLKTRNVIGMMNNSYLYCFDSYIHPLPPNFYVCTDADLQTKRTLQSPWHSFSLPRMCCGLQNNCLYLYDPSLIQNPQNDKSASNIYTYYCERDCWYPISRMKEPLLFCGMTACDNSLYLIGGQRVDHKIPAGYAQAYDCRSGEWRELKKSKYQYVSPACCTFEGKIYVRDIESEVYEPTAGKWRTLESPVSNSGYPHHRMVPYANRLWLLSSSHHQKNNENSLYLSLYSPKSDKWTFSTMISKKIRSIEYLLDAVVFKS